ncbi:hypothetical protein [Qipengyuania sp. ASV99]|uniref:hypothetical protein n=1 Tax=Qipengyuania sp. ASV99 TaxID=3399681 RepID=UPI003A4C556D
MRLRNYFERKPAAYSAAHGRSKSAPRSIAAHGSFVPMLTIWGAALLGLAIIVLPDSAIVRMSMVSGLVSLGGSAKFVFAGIAAALGGGLAFVIANALRDRARGNEAQVSVVGAVSSRRVRPIDPVTDLGSDSLDAPIETMPFGVEDEEDAFDPAAYTGNPAAIASARREPTLGELAKRGYEIEEPQDAAAPETTGGFTRRHFKDALIETCEGATCEAAAGVVDTAAGEYSSLSRISPKPKAGSAPLAERPRALDLSEFAELPGRNAVWVEEQGAEKASASPSSIRPAQPPATALEKLRQTPPEDLSLVQMVERFAAALHERQESERSGPSRRGSRHGTGGETVLAEALKALDLFTKGGFDLNSDDATDQTAAEDGPDELGQTERQLRDALVKLRSLRGAG